MADPKHRESDRKWRERAIEEYHRNPISTLLNMIQLFILIGGLVVIGINIGVFKTDFKFIREANAADHAVLRDKICKHTKDEFELPSQQLKREEY
jgi:hypothetical protein